MRRSLSTMSWTVLIASFLGCPGTEDVDCTAIAAVSVSVSVVDDDGIHIPEATVTYLAEGADTPEQCEEIGDDFLCGYEVSGEILIQAEAEGYQSAEETVVVEEDECHVLGESIELVLQPVDCPQVENPSVLVTVVDPSDQVITDAHVEYAPECEDWFAPEPCEPYGEDQWICGWGFTCPLYIDASAPGFQQGSEIVDPDEDECGVVTTEFDFVLQPEE